MNDKPGLRAALRVRRAELARAAPGAGEMAAARLPPGLLRGRRVVAGYRPHGGEIDPAPLMRRFAQAGASLCLPVALTRSAPLVFRAWREGEALAPDAFGVPAPLASRDQVFPDVIIAPVLAFDRRGNRLGQGAGCFDRSLARLRAHGQVLVIGLAFAGQEVDAAPVEAHDEILDVILTETGYIEVARGAGA